MDKRTDFYGMGHLVWVAIVLVILIIGVKIYMVSQGLDNDLSIAP